MLPDGVSRGGESRYPRAGVFPRAGVNRRFADNFDMAVALAGDGAKVAWRRCPGPVPRDVPEGAAALTHMSVLERAGRCG